MGGRNTEHRFPGLAGAGEIPTSNRDVSQEIVTLGSGTAAEMSRSIGQLLRTRLFLLYFTSLTITSGTGATCTMFCVGLYVTVPGSSSSRLPTDTLCEGGCPLSDQTLVRFSSDRELKRISTARCGEFPCACT